MRQPWSLIVLLLILISPLHAVEYTTYGPNFTFPSGVNMLKRSAAYNKTIFNSGVIDPTIPVIRIGASWADNESDEFAGLDYFLAYMIDYINLKGGVVCRGLNQSSLYPTYNQTLNGTRFYLSLSFAKNDESDSYMQLIHNDLAAQWNGTGREINRFDSIPASLHTAPLPFVLAPPYDQLTVLSPLVSSFNQTYMAVSNPDPASFAQRSKNLWSMIVTGDLAYTPAIRLINQRAQYYAAQFGNNTNPNSPDYASPQGIRSACLYAANDSLSQIYVQAIRTWIDRENVRRANLNVTSQDMIKVYVDAPWNPLLANGTDYTIVYDDYVNSFASCFDGVDLLVAIPDPTSGVVVASALADAQLRPKAVMGLGYNNLRVTGASIASTNGWIVVNPVNLSSATYPGSVFGSALSGITGFYSYAAAVPAIQSARLKISPLLYMGALDIICGALSVTSGLDKTSIRSALLSMSGTMALFSALRFNVNTGINTVAPANAINQILNSVSKTIPSNVPQNLVYPYPWPWHRTEVGDLVISDQNITSVLVATVICVLGAWVSLIVVEQAIFVRRKGGDYRPWLLITSIALGGVSVWCGFFQQTAALSLTKPDDMSEMSIEWSLGIAFLGLMSPLVLTYMGMQIMILSIEDPTTPSITNEAAQAKATLRLEREEKRKKAALDNKAHVIHLYQSFNWRSLAGGLLTVCGVLTCRVTLFYIWSAAIDHTTVFWAWCITVPGKLLLVTISIHMFFFAIRYRPLAAFIFAAACVMDWQVHVNSMEFRYHPENQTDPQPAALYQTLVGSTTVTIITGTLAAVICFVFIGLQFSRMQLSRNGLSVLVASLESVIHQQRRTLRDDTNTFSKMKTFIDHQCRMIEAINLLTPFAHEHAFALASQGSMASYVHFNVSGHGRRPSTLARTGMRVAQDRDRDEPVSVTPSARSSNNSPNLSAIPGNLLITPLTPVTHTVSVTTANNAFALATVAYDKDGSKSPNKTKDARKDDHNFPRRSIASNSNQIIPLSTEPSLNQSSASLPDNSPKSAITIQKSTVNMSDISDTSQLLFTRTSIVSHQGKPSSHSKPGDTPPGEGDISKSSPVGAEAFSRASLVAGAASANTSSKIGRESTTRSSNSSSGNKGMKAFEDDCIQLLEQINGFKRDNFAPQSRASASRSSLGGEDDDESVYSSKLPLVLRESATELMSLPASATSPSLATLLAHPVCVEVIKQELQSIHSTENLMFWLHATRYRRCASSRLRKLLAQAIFDCFIKEGAPQQININTRQRDAISALVLSKRHDDAFTTELFREAEHEVMLLMETNMMKSFSHTSKYRLCAWICYAIDANIGNVDMVAEFEKAGSARSRKDSMLISSTNESNLDSNVERTAYATRTQRIPSVSRDNDVSTVKVNGSGPKRPSIQTSGASTPVGRSL